MVKLGARGMRMLKLLHLLTVSCWLGGGVCMNGLLLVAKAARTPENLVYFYQLLAFIDMKVIVPGAMGTLLTGAAYGLLTRWGFFRQGWLSVKWLITLAVIGTGAGLTSKWLNALESMTEQKGLLVWQQADYLTLFAHNQWLGMAQMGLLLLAVLLSVFKPRGKAYQERRQERIQ